MLSTYFHTRRWKMPSFNRAVAALALISSMMLGSWEAVRAVSQIGTADYPHTLADFREGRTTLALEKQIEQRLPSRKSLIAFANGARFLITGGGGDQVRVGKSDWLFLAEEMRFDATGNSNLIARADLLGAAVSRLDSMGVKLVVALVPDKARVYSGRLRSAQYPAYNETRYGDALRAMRARNVTVVDLLGPLAAGAAKSDVYYRTDTHWNQVGAKIAADAVATVVRQLGVTLKQTQFSTDASSAKIQRPGDLIRLMGLEDAPNTFRPHADEEAPVATRQISADNAGGLFGDAGVPVVLTGTSYSLRGNFHGYLEQALESKVLNAAKDGGGFLQATTAYLTDDSFISAKPTVLVWEIPERFVTTAINGEPTWLDKVGLHH